MHGGFRIAAVAALVGFFLLPGATVASATSCLDPNLSWCASVRPSSGPIGTRVVANGTTDPYDVSNLQHGLGLFLMRDVGPPFCEVIGGVHDAHLSVSDAGIIHGSFVVGGATSCNHSDAAAPPLTPGRYIVSLGCVACEIAYFTVTANAPTLPFTGGRPLWPLVVIGGLSVAAGLALNAPGRLKRVGTRLP